MLNAPATKLASSPVAAFTLRDVPRWHRFPMMRDMMADCHPPLVRAVLTATRQGPEALCTRLANWPAPTFIPKRDLCADGTRRRLLTGRRLRPPFAGRGRVARHAGWPNADPRDGTADAH
jgi:hypothetical protein